MNKHKYIPQAELTREDINPEVLAYAERCLPGIKVMMGLAARKEKSDTVRYEWGPVHPKPPRLDLYELESALYVLLKNEYRLVMLTALGSAIVITWYKA